MTFPRFRAVLAFSSLLLMAPVCGVFADSPASERRVALILDQPPIVPAQIESDFVAEIASDLDAADPTFSLTVLNVADSGVVSRSGAPVDLAAFDVVWAHQGDAISASSTLFSPPVVSALRSFVESAPERGVFLTGGAAALLEPLGFGPIKTAPVTFGDDRAQAGLVPVNPNAAFFADVEPDRGTCWITNAAFPAFAEFSATGSNVRTLATTPGGPALPLLVALDESGKTDENAGRVKAAAFAWRVSPLFDRAAPFFKNNLKAFLRNGLRQVGANVAASDFVAPAFVLPDFDALERSISHLVDTFGDDYPNGPRFLERLTELREQARTVADAETAAALTASFVALQKEALLANPDLDFDSFLAVRRDPNKLGFPDNYNSNSVLPPTGYRNALVRVDVRTGESVDVYAPKHDEFVGDLELHYDADKVMFSAPDSANPNPELAKRWRLWELPLDSEGNATGAPTLLPTIEAPDVDNYDACYLPDGRVVFCSTACQTGVPCIDGSGRVCNLYLREKDGSARQLTLEQDHDWNPVVLNNGRVMYLRWEYVDLPHAFSRIMFHMNPDGTNQTELYGSGSYWPAAMFGARPLPGDSSKFVAIVGGHHETPRIGDLVVFDPSRGRRETTGAVQRIPGFGKEVQPIVADLPIAQTWPKFVHPFPISEEFFLVSCKRSASEPWEICLVDVFDNIVTLCRDEANALLEPIPFRPTERQPIVPDRVVPGAPEADVFIADIYEGRGLPGVERGEVAALRVFSYHFSYQGMGAEPHGVGLDGPWDPRRVIGTVPILEDGSATFKIPAMTPIALQPIDKNGKALQLMRSWITALPGESVSCVGCHEDQNETSPTTPRTLASQMKPLEIEPFFGPARGFSFEREIQPILDRYCLDCHRPDSETVAKMIADGELAPDVRSTEKRPGQTFAFDRIPDFRRTAPTRLLEAGNYIDANSRYSNAYYQLRRFVAVSTKENQMATHRPYEFHADHSEVVRLLETGHYAVELDEESWAKLIAWIDLGAPYFGNWGEIRNHAIPELVKAQWSRRSELRRLYSGAVPQLDDDPTVPVAPLAASEASPESKRRLRFSLEKRPDADDSTWRRDGADEREPFSVDLGDGIKLEMVPIPGSNFFASRFEIANEQYRVFDPTFDAGLEYGDFIQFSPGEIGWLLSRKKQPVARTTWSDAVEFCAWLSEKTGRKFRLPTASEWRFAASGGVENAKNWFGDVDDYAPFENFADSTFAKIDPISWSGRVDALPAWRPADWNVDDRGRVSTPVGSYAANPFGLFDAQGNVAEWTASEVVQIREVIDENGAVVERSETPKKVVCGGSWRVEARKGTLDAQRYYPARFNLRDVGFRVICVD